MVVSCLARSGVTEWRVASLKSASQLSGPSASERISRAMAGCIFVREQQTSSRISGEAISFTERYPNRANQTECRFYDIVRTAGEIPPVGRAIWRCRVETAPSRADRFEGLRVRMSLFCYNSTPIHG